MGFDAVTYAAAKGAANSYTDIMVEMLEEGMTYKGSVVNQAALPASGNQKGDAYNCADGTGLFVWNGTAWTSTSKAGPQGPAGATGPQGPKGEDGSNSVSVSATGTSTNQVKYITIDGVESKLDSEAFKPFKSAWVGSNLTTTQAAAMILADASVKAGDAYAGGVEWSDLYEAIGLNNGEATARVGDNKSFVLFTMSSSDTEPYEWNYNSFADVWRSYVPIYDNLQSTVTTAALSANMGKELQDEINNLKNIGRFLAIWNSATGLPLTNPTVSPYTYKTGDYYRVGTVAEGSANNYKPNGASYTRDVPSTTVETEDVEVGWVYYYDGSQWLAQSAGGGGTVQDVQVNGTSIVASGTGIANIPIASSSVSGVMTSSQYTKLDGIQTNAITLTARVSGQSYPSGTFTYVAEV